MKTNTDGKTWRSARVLLASAIATATMASGNAALANGNRNIAISGNSTFSDCGVAGSDFGLLMTGDLKGCLSIFVQSFTCNELNDFDHYTERGREAFVGTGRDVCRLRVGDCFFAFCVQRTSYKQVSTPCACSSCFQGLDQ